MKEIIPRTSLVALLLLVKTTRLRTYGCIAIVSLVGCTATQVRWDASNIREQVMVYYNDQIMDNLIRARKRLPFVHVDIQLLTSQGASQITGTVGGGETRSNTNASMAGVVGTITRAVMRPFTYSVAPTRSETLSITAAPALGSQALASPTPSSSSSPNMVETRVTETTGPDGRITSTTKEKTLKPGSQPTPITIYELYEKFAACHLSDAPIQPQKGAYVPGTLKRWGTQYYYIKQKKDGLEYYKFCKALFTKGQAGSLEKQLEATRAEVEAVKAQLATPVPP